MKLHIENFDYQEEALYHEYKYGIWAAGRQIGKTEGAKNWLLEKLLENKDNGLWIDTRYSNIDKYIERYFKPTLKDVWKRDTYNQQKKTMRLPSGSMIDFGSAEKPELLEGFNYGYVVVNEAGIVLKNPELWYDTLQPMTNRAQVRFIGATKGKGLFHKLYTLGLNGKNKEYMSKRTTCYESPLWTKEKLDNIKKTIPDHIFRQAYLAEFIDSESTVFRKVKGCIRKIQLISRGIVERRYVMAVDLAKHEDFTVIFVADEVSKEIVYFERFNQIDWSLQKKRIAQVSANFFKPTIKIDATGVGDAIYDDLVRMGLNVVPFKFTNTSKADLIENLIVAIENEEILFPAISELLDELEIYEMSVTRLGNITYNAPDGFHDDCVISLALLVSILKDGNWSPIG